MRVSATKIESPTFDACPSFCMFQLLLSDPLTVTDSGCPGDCVTNSPIDIPCNGGCDGGVPPAMEEGGGARQKIRKIA